MGPLNLQVSPLSIQVGPLNLQLIPLNLQAGPLNLPVDPYHLKAFRWVHCLQVAHCAMGKRVFIDGKQICPS